MIEAMACGTPVLAFRCGSVPEIVEDGLTGAIVDTMEDAIAALPSVIALDRKKVHQRFAQRFSARRMAKDYLTVYRSLLASWNSRNGETGKPQYPLADDEITSNKGLQVA